MSQGIAFGALPPVIELAVVDFMLKLARMWEPYVQVELLYFVRLTTTS